MIRLKDIAQRAGVSVMTVSKVLHNAPDISEATKARVRHLAGQMGYLPDSMARSLRTRTTRLLGVLISASAYPLYPRMLMGLEERAFDLGYELLLGHTLNQPEREASMIRRFVARRVDGLLIAPVYRLAPAAAVYEELRRRRVPTLLLGHRAPFCSHFISIETDDLTGSYRAAQHLLKLGHKTIAFLAGPQFAPWAQERAQGYRRALDEAQVEVEDKLIFQAGASLEEGEGAARQLLAEGVRPTAIQAVNDLVAVGAANVFLREGFRVPDQISIIGFGNFTAGEFYQVPLTTVREPQNRLGLAAMEMMQRLIRGENVASERLAPDLILRSSTAPPPIAGIGRD